MLFIDKFIEVLKNSQILGYKKLVRFTINQEKENSI
jgi:hypothetical protein